MDAHASLPYAAHDDIVRLVGRPAADRGRTYAVAGNVTGHTWDAANSVLSARVAGSQTSPYTVFVDLEPLSEQSGQSAQGGLLRCRPVHATCSCYVGADCKHAAAVLFAVNLLAMQPHLAALDALGTQSTLDAPAAASAIESPRGAGTAASAAGPGGERPGGRGGEQAVLAHRGPDWRSILSQMGASAQTPEAAQAAPLAIGVEIVAPPSRDWYAPKVTSALTVEQIAAGAAAVVQLRPLRPGRREAWIRGGLSWRDFITPGQHSDVDPAHASALARLCRLYYAERHAFTLDGQTIRLDAFSSSLIWDLLAESAAAGVSLIGMGIVRRVELLGAARFRLDVRAPAQEQLQISPVVDSADSPFVLPRAVGLYGAADLDIDAAAGLLDLRLAPLAQPLPPGTDELLQHGGLQLDAEDSTEFLEQVYPGLHRTLPFISSDESVEFPQIGPPDLRLQAQFGDEDELHLAWSWQYHDPSRVLPVHPGPLHAGTGRDPEAEAALLTEVRELWPTAAQLGREALHGVDTARFTENVLPQLEDHPRIRIEIAGERAEYRELDAVPSLQVSTVESQKNDWFDLGVIVTVAGRTIPFAPLFTALVKGLPHLILPDKTHFSLDHPAFDTLRRVIAEAEALGEWDPAAPRISRYQVSMWDELTDSADEVITDPAWAAAVDGLREVGSIPHTPVPAGVQAQLRHYQEEGFHWLAFLYEQRLGGILADDMGLGKTLQTLALIAHARRGASGSGEIEAAAGAGGTGEIEAAAVPAESEAAAPFLVIAPASVVSVWQAEAARFVPGLDVRVLGSTTGKRGTSIAQARAGADVIITSYTLLRIDAEEFSSLPWSGLVLDEAQFVKNHTAAVHHAAAAIRAPFRLAITGTPMENSLTDLWSLLAITAPGLFPSSQRFRREYVHPIEAGVAPERMARLRTRVRPFMLRRTKDLVASDLPPKQEQLSMVELSPKHRRLYASILQRERKKVLGLIDDLDKHRFTVFRSLTLLRMAALDPAIVDDSYADIPSSKLQALLPRLEEIIDEGHRIIVFSQFTSFLHRVGDALSDRGVDFEYLDGSTRNRGSVIDSFTTGTAPVFLISLKAGGFGLTLTEADYVFLLDPWWNPAAEAQAVDRTHRIGQTKSVMVYRMVAAGTIEEKVLALQQKKSALFTSLMDEGDAFSSTMTAQDLRELFADL